MLLIVLMGYVSITEANTYLETNGEDELISNLINHASNLIDRFCGLQSTESKFALELDTISNERHDYNDVGPYYFKNIPINSITEINGTAITLTELEDYIAKGREVTFDASVNLTSYNTKFNIITFSYSKGYRKIPGDIKAGCLMIVAGLYSIRKLKGINSFNQGDLSLSLSLDGIFGKDTNIYDEVRLILSKYKIVNAIS